MDEQRQWWEELFQIHEYAQFAAAAKALTEAEIDFLVEVLRLEAGSSLLDLGSGNGRHVLELARRGIHAEGIELVPAVVQHARQQAMEEGLWARLIQGDMREISALGPFDAVIIMNSSFGFFSDAENAALLASAKEALAPGGRLLLQCINPYQIETYLKGFRTGWHKVGPGYVLRQSRFDPREGAIRTEYTYVDPSHGETQHPGERIRLYTYQELLRLLRQAGLRPLMVFGDATLPAKPFEEDSQWQIIIATNDPE